jgi:crotonobetaine/carnitine-CoA ligase
MREQAASLGSETWLLSGDRTLTFGQANALINRYAHGLVHLGVAQGEVVAMVMAPSIEVVLIAVAVAKLGAVFTTISTDFTGKFLDEALQAARPRVLVIDEDIQGRLSAIDGVGGAQSVLVNGKAGADGAWSLSDLHQFSDKEPPEVGHWLDPVQVWWSSGTTGKPKGVAHSNSSLLMQTVSHDRDIRSGDTLYSCTPVYLGSSWTGTIWPSLVMGVRSAIDPKFSVSRFWACANHYRATHAFTLGAMHMHLWNAPPAATDRDNTLRRYTAIPMPSDIIPAFKERFGIESMPQGYGTSETFRVFDLPEDGTDREGAILGKPVAHLEVAILDEEDRPVPEGSAGEICVRPRQPGLMFCGYFNDPARTVEAWRSMWHHTGDMAFKGDDGLYRFADRKKDYIRYKGRNISMFEVEAVVAAHADVKDVAAYGLPSAELESESELMVAVVLKPGCALSHEQIARHINHNAPHYFVPRFIELVDTLPRNDHGRLVKNDLRERGVGEHTWDRDGVGFEVIRP